MIFHFIAFVSSLFWSLRYASALHIRASETPRYLRKSSNLALCYVGFISDKTYSQATRAGLAAFLCCTYDVVTDWRGFRGDDTKIFVGLLQRHAPKLKDIALDLLVKDSLEQLNDDGLERGVISVRFITGLIGSASYFKNRVDLYKLGMALQIVDDVLDYQEDVKFNDTNCLTSHRWEEYILLLKETLPEPELIRLFPNGTVLKYIVKRASEKAEHIMERRVSYVPPLSGSSVIGQYHG